MRDARYIAEHRGGCLKMEDHRRLIRWARECAQHILPLFGDPVDSRLTDALAVAKNWESGKVKTGVAMKASLAAHSVARESSNPVSTAVARAVGQAVATAHMADHSLGAALYGLKALKFAGKSLEKERYWQMEQLPPLPEDLLELIRTTLKEKGMVFE